MHHARSGRFPHYYPPTPRTTPDMLMSSTSIPTSPEPANNAKKAEFTAWKRWFWPALTIVLVLDQVSKYWIFSLPPDANLPGWIELTYNTGVAWGMFGDSPAAVMAMTLILIPILAWVYWKNFRAAGRGHNLAFGMILGGALGNAWDRIMTNLTDSSAGYAGVRDFIRVDLHAIGIPYTWPNFNIADSAISVGFCLLLILAVISPTASRS